MAIFVKCWVLIALTFKCLQISDALGIIFLVVLKVDIHEFVLFSTLKFELGHAGVSVVHSHLFVLLCFRVTLVKTLKCHSLLFLESFLL